VAQRAEGVVALHLLAGHRAEGVKLLVHSYARGEEAMK
jgi:hypothetical protein